jgi:hypothetical protein
MFPVPSHLPRTGGDHLTSPPNELETSPLAPIEVDTVLDLFEPLLRDGQALDSKTVKGVRESLQAAIIQNKVSCSCLCESYEAERTGNSSWDTESELSVHIKSY